MIVKCCMCGADKKISPSRNDGRNFFCSQKCHYLHNSKFVKGRNHHNYGKKASAETIKKLSISHTGKFGDKSSNWKGGTSKFRKKFMTASRYYLWRRAVLGIGKNKCALCGGKTRLQAHHIFSFKDYPELRLCVGNGVVLCLGCHWFIHRNINKKVIVL